MSCSHTSSRETQRYLSRDKLAVKHTLALADSVGLEPLILDVILLVALAPDAPPSPCHTAGCGECSAEEQLHLAHNMHRVRQHTVCTLAVRVEP